MFHLTALLFLAACGEPAPTPTTEAPTEAKTEAPTPEPEPVVEASPGAWQQPDTSHLPDDPLVQRGYALTMDTHRLLPDNVGDKLNCTNCHRDAGTRAKAAPWVGVTTRYPKYRARSGKVDELPERINGCMERSMNGTRLDLESEDMKAFVAYMTWLSDGIEDGKALDDIGMPRIKPPEEPDAERGKALYTTKCVACHQQEGTGLMGAEDATVFPALWGEHSYNVGAGMARLNTAAAFIRWNMPQGQEGTLTDQEAYDIASYFIFQDRPDFAGKDNDWPKGDKPEDARY